MYGRRAVRETRMSEGRERCSQDVLSERNKRKGGKFIDLAFLPLKIHTPL